MARPPDLSPALADQPGEEDRPVFSVQLWQYRTERSWTQEELAERAGLSPRGIRALEQGERSRPYKHTVRLLADALGLAGEERTRFAEAARRSSRPTPTSRSSTLQTFLIADLRGYTQFTAERGDEAAAQLTSRFAEVTEEVVGRFDGRVIELRGDEVLASFSSARQALRASVQLRSRLEELGRDVPVEVGIGLDAGDAVPVKGGYRTGALNLAARLQSLAHGEVFATQTVVALARKTEGIAFFDRGEVVLRGLPRPVKVIQVAPEGESAGELPPLQPILATHPTNIPDEPTPFIGREREIDQIAGLLRAPHTRMATLTGTGGTGKTRLAVQVANRLLYAFRDGVFFISLASLTDPALVPAAVAEALGVKEQPGRDLLATLTAYLKEEQLLLVLDNFEHLLDTSLVVAGLLDGCVQLHVLVTSRIPLHLSREHQYPVPPLAIPDLQHLPDAAALSRYEAVALFIERAGAIKPGFQVTPENAQAVAAICSRLDGLPLAIELAAARIKLFPPQALLQRLSSRLRVLTGGPKDRPSRQQTLRNTIDWSYSLLSLSEQILFARLSVFAAGCTFEAADAVCNGEGNLDMLDVLASLVDQSLLRQEGEQPRFQMLETVREYAIERLEERGEAEEFRNHHTEYFLALAEEAHRERREGQQAVALAHLETEHANLQAALEWSLGRERAVERGLQLSSALFAFWIIRGHVSEQRRWLDAALRKIESAPPLLRAWLLFRAGEIEHRTGNRQRADALFEQSLAMFTDLDDKDGMAEVLHALGDSAMDSGDYVRAAARLEQGLALWRELGHKQGVHKSLGMLGELAHHRGDDRRAHSLFEQALSLQRELGDIAGSARSLMRLAWAATSGGRYDEAVSMLEEVRTLADDLGDKNTIGLALNGLGHIAFLQGENERANALSTESEAIFRGIESTMGRVATLHLLGMVRQDQGDADGARAALIESLKLSRQAGLQPMYPPLLEAFAEHAERQGRAEQAATLFGTAEAARESMRLPLEPSEKLIYDRWIAAARSQVDEETWTRTWKQGRAMSLEEAITYALSESE